MTLTLAAAYARHPDSRGSFLTFPVQLSHERNKIACTSGYSFNVRTVPAAKSATPTSLAADAAAAAAACKWNSKNSHSLFLDSRMESHFRKVQRRKNRPSRKRTSLTLFRHSIYFSPARAIQPLPTRLGRFSFPVE